MSIKDDNNKNDESVQHTIWERNPLLGPFICIAGVFLALIGAFLGGLHVDHSNHIGIIERQAELLQECKSPAVKPANPFITHILREDGRLEPIKPKLLSELDVELMEREY